MRKSAPSYDQTFAPIRDQRKSRGIPEWAKPPGTDRLDDSIAKATTTIRPREERYNKKRMDERIGIITDEFHPLQDSRRFEAVKARHAEEAARKSRRGQFQNTFNVNTGTDFTVHLDLPLYKDYDKQFETLSYLRRSGQFQAAIEYVKRVFEDHLSHPYIFVQHAELLLDMGDYKSFKQLASSSPFDDRLNNASGIGLLRQSGTVRHFYPRHGGKIRTSELPISQQEERRARSPHPPTHKEIWHAPFVSRAEKRNQEDQSSEDGYHLLRWNWKLLKALSQIHLTGKINEALEQAQFVLDNLVIYSEIGSTEIQIISLALQIFGLVELWLPDIFKIEVRDSLEAWTKWSELYKSLLAQGRVWDFRDVFLSAIGVLGLRWTCSIFFPGSPWREAILDNWILQERDQSTTLAQLDILSSMILNLNLSERSFAQMEWLEKDSQLLAELIINKYPASMNSRPFLKWLVIKAATVPITQQPGIDRRIHHPEFMFRDWPGFSIASRSWFSLPIYVPTRTEIPSWDRPEIPETANEPIRLALSMATQLHDYALQVLCIKVLILRSQQPQKLFEQLCKLQESTQEDVEGYLSTCLSRYLVDRDKQAQKKLLSELKELDDWVSDYDLRSPPVYLAKSYIQDALTQIIKGRDYVAPPNQFHTSYYTWLADKTRLTVTNNLSSDVPSSQLPRDERSSSHHGDMPSATFIENHDKTQHERPPDSAKKHGLVQISPGDRRRERRQNEDGEVEVVEEHDGGLRPMIPTSSRRVVSTDRHGERRSRSRRRDWFYSKDRPASSTGSYLTTSSSELDSGAENMLAFFPHIPDSLAVELSRRKVEGKRIIMEVRDAKTDEKTMGIDWVKQGDEVTLTMSQKDAGTSITLKKNVKTPGKKWVENRDSSWRVQRKGDRKGKGKGKGKEARRRHRRSSSPSSYSYASYSDEADSEGDDSSESDTKGSTRGKGKGKGGGAKEHTQERVETDPDPAVQPTVEAEPEMEQENVEAGPRPLPEVETEPEAGVEDV